MLRKILSVWDQEELHYIAEELIIALRDDFFLYDDEGNCLLDPCQSREERLALRWRENLKLWTIQWEQEKRRSGEKRDKDESNKSI